MLAGDRHLGDQLTRCHVACEHEQPEHSLHDADEGEEHPHPPSAPHPVERRGDRDEVGAHERTRQREVDGIAMCSTNTSLNVVPNAENVAL